MKALRPTHNKNRTKKRTQTPKTIHKLQQMFQPNTILVLHSDNSHSSSDTTSKKDVPENNEGTEAALQELNMVTKDEGCKLTEKPSSLQDILGYDYFEFQRYLQLQSELQRRDRLENLACGRSSKPLEYYMEDVLTKEFVDIYGKIDSSSEQGKQILTTFKEGRLTEIKSWLKFEEEFKNDLPGLKYYNDFLDPKSEKTTIENKKSFPERQLLYDQNPSTNSHNFERFILPRRLPRKVREVLGENISSDDETDEDKKENSRVLNEIDLRIFDPKFIFPNNVVQTQQYPLYQPLAEKLLKLIDDYKLGIQPVQFDNEWVAKYDYYINTSNYGAGTFAELISMLPDIFCMRCVGGSLNLIFPAYLNEFMVSADKLYKRLWQRLIFLLHYHEGKLSTDENLTTLMQQFFQVDFKVCAQNLEFFVNNFLPQHFPQEDLILLNSKDSLELYLQFQILKDSNDKRPEFPNKVFQKYPNLTDIKEMIDAHLKKEYIPPDFLINLKPHAADLVIFGYNDNFYKGPKLPDKILLKRIKEAIEEAELCARIKNLSPLSWHSQQDTIDGRFACIHDDVEWMSEYIKADSHTTCMGGEIVSFDCFYVNCCEFWQPLIEFMFKLQQEYQNVDQLRAATPRPEYLLPGLFVAVLYRGVNNKDPQPEFHRAKIIEVPKDEMSTKYLILLIDFGEMLEVDFEDIKFLPKHFLTGFPAQAIECEANLSLVYQSFRKTVGWPKELMHLFVKKIQDKKMNIHFRIPATQQPRVGSGIKWVVSADFVSHENTKIITESQIIKKFLKEIEGEYYESISTRIGDISSDDSIDRVD